MPMMGLNLDRWLSRRQPYHCTITTYTYSEFIIGYLYVMIVYYFSLDNATFDATCYNPHDVLSLAIIM